MNELKIAALLVVLLGASLQANPASAPKTVVVLLDKMPRGFVYTIDSVTTPHGALLTRLAERKGTGPATSPEARILVTEEASLKMIDDLRGLVAKAGYQSTRVFYFGRDKRLMVELKALDGVPFSATAKLPGEP